MEPRNQEKAETHRALMGELGKIKSKEVWLETTATTTHTLSLLITPHGCERWSVMRADGKKMVFHQKDGVGGEPHRHPGHQKDE